MRDNTLRVEHYSTVSADGSFKGMTPVAISEFRGKSADTPDNLLGATLDFAILDEAAIMTPEIWHEKIQPMLSTRKGWVMFISTPRGHNWFYDEFRKGWRGKKVNGAEPDDTYKTRFGPLGVNYPPASAESELFEDQESFHCASWEAREDVGLDWYLKAKATSPDQSFRQEYGAEFISHSGSVFGEGIQSILRLPYHEDNYRWVVRGPRPDREYVIGADFAKSQDFSVFSVLDSETADIVCMLRVNDTSWANQKRLLAELANEYNDAMIVADSWGVGDTLVEDLEINGLRVTRYPIKNVAVKEEIINHLSLLMLEEMVSVPDHPEIFKELRNFQYFTSASGTVTMRAWGKGHDDIVISLALAYSTVRGDELLGIDTSYDGPDHYEFDAVDTLTEWAFDNFMDEFHEANRMFS